MLKFAPVFLVCFIPRLGYLWWTTPLDPPDIYYWELSDPARLLNLLGFDGRPSTAIEPLYPLFLAVLRWLTGDDLFWILVLQIAVASLGAVYFFRLCLLLADERTARIAVLLFSFYPYLVRQSASFIEITPLATLLIATAFHFCRIANVRGAAVAGVAFGITLLARSAVLPVLLLCAAFLSWRRRGAQALTLVLTALLVTLPMGLRNFQSDGSILPTRIGANLFAGNNHYAGEVIPGYNVDLLDGYAQDTLQQEEPQLVNAGEPQIDAFYLEEAIEWMLEEPLSALRQDLLNIAYFFHPRIVPYHPIDRNTRLVFTGADGIRVEGGPVRGAVAGWLHGLCYSGIFLSAVAGIWLRRKQAGNDAVLYLMLLGFLVMSSVFFPTTRLRAPVEFVLMFFSACALARWTRRA